MAGRLHLSGWDKARCIVVLHRPLKGEMLLAQQVDRQNVPGFVDAEGKAGQRVTGYEVSLETSGALDIAEVDPRVARVMDLKAPASGECARNRWENLAWLTPRDEIKIVVASRADYEWAHAAIRERRLDTLCAVLLSPAHGLVDPTALADWILEDGLNVRFQFQLHKLLWGSAQGK